MTSLVALGQPGFWQIVIVLALLLLFFGSNRLPRMARSLGSSLTEFKKGLRGEPDEDEKKKLKEKAGGEGGGNDDEPKKEASKEASSS